MILPACWGDLFERSRSSLRGKGERLTGRLFQCDVHSRLDSMKKWDHSFPSIEATSWQWWPGCSRPIPRSWRCSSFNKPQVFAQKNPQLRYSSVMWCFYSPIMCLIPQIHAAPKNTSPACQEAFQLLGFPSDIGDWSGYMVEDTSWARGGYCTSIYWGQSCC